MRTWETTSAEETQALAREILQEIGGTGVLLLEGDLGAGKTCFVQGLAQALGISEAVTSPTYSLVKIYGAADNLIHADLYRLTEEDELYDLGLEEWLEGSGILAVEWPSRAPDLWRDTDWRMRFEASPKGPDVRVIHLEKVQA